MLRLLALLAGLAGVTDLGAGGQPDESLRRCVVATRLARLTGSSEAVVRDVQQVALLGHIGCLAWSHEAGTIWGDDIAMTHAALMADPASAAYAVRLFVPMVAAATGRSRAGVAMTMLRTSRHTAREAPVATCEVAEAAGRRLAFSPLVVASLGHVTAGWNGCGYPTARGEQIPLPARLMHVAMVAVLFADALGLEAATTEVRRRAGGHLDPDLATACADAMGELYGGLDTDDPFSVVLDLEPDPAARVDTAGLADIARVCGELVDLKSPWLQGHSSAVAELAGAAATGLGLPEAEQVRVAGYLHDVGRAGLPSRLWALPRAWTAAERDQAQLHTYYTERVLSRVAELGAVADLAGLHHERCDGSGYHRGLHGDRIPMGARVLATADAYRLLIQDRADRPGLVLGDAARRLRAEADSGRLDPDAVSAVLAGAGAAHVPAGPGVAGLTSRQLEVLRPVTRGLSNRQIARQLVLSPRTVDRHVADVYQRIGVSSRAAAAMFCMEHGLLGMPGHPHREDG